MKLIFPTLLLTLLAFTSCDKSDDNRPNDILPSAEYVWVRSSGGIGGITFFPDDVGYQELLTIDENRFLVTRDGEITEDFIFSLEFEYAQEASGDVPAYDIYKVINENFPDQAYYYFWQYNESYFFSDICCDGFTREFRR